MDLTPQSRKPRDVAGRLLEKMLMPIVATAASAAAGYAVKRVRELAAEPRRAVSSNGHPERRVSSVELERRRQDRERGRAERRKATT